MDTTRRKPLFYATYQPRSQQQFIFSSQSNQHAMNTIHPIPKGRVQVKLGSCLRSIVLVLNLNFQTLVGGVALVGTGFGAFWMWMQKRQAQKEQKGALPTCRSFLYCLSRRSHECFRGDSYLPSTASR